MKGNLILIHGGGPTAVINASLAGAIRQAKKEPGVDRILAAIGGTGGHHRSVAVTHALAEFVQQAGYPVTEIHRDITR